MNLRRGLLNTSQRHCPGPNGHEPPYCRHAARRQQARERRRRTQEAQTDGLTSDLEPVQAPRKSPPDAPITDAKDPDQFRQFAALPREWIAEHRRKHTPPSRTLPEAVDRTVFLHPTPFLAVGRRASPSTYILRRRKRFPSSRGRIAVSLFTRVPRRSVLRSSRPLRGLVFSPSPTCWRSVGSGACTRAKGTPGPGPGGR
jgi:hypothetical protein